MLKNGLTLMRLGIIASSFQFASSEKEIIWTDIEKVEAEIKKSKRPLMIFISSKNDWASKNVRKYTFSDPSVINYLNQHFYASEVDFYHKNSITFYGHTFKHLDTTFINYEDTIVKETVDTVISETNDTILTTSFDTSYSSTKHWHHELPHALLDGNIKWAYPFFAFFDSDMKRIIVIKGYQNPKTFIMILHFLAEKAYLTTTWEKYKEGFER